MHFIVVLLAAIVLCFFVYVFGTIVVAKVLRVPFDEVGLFVGPRLFGVKRNGVEYRLNAIPLGSYVRFSRPEFESTSGIKLVAVSLAGCVATFLMAVLCLSGPDAVHMLFRGFVQILSGALGPRDEGAALVRSGADFVRHHGFVAVLGATAAKSTAFNLLPLPNLAGGMSILTLLGVRRSERAAIIAGTVGVVFTLVLCGCWVIAIISALG